MPLYEIQGPDGKLYEIEGPPNATKEQIVAAVQRGLQAPKEGERTWGEAVTDVGAGLVQGAGSLVSLPGQLYGLATGDFSPHWCAWARSVHHQSW